MSEVLPLQFDWQL